MNTVSQVADIDHLIVNNEHGRGKPRPCFCFLVCDNVGHCCFKGIVKSPLPKSFTTWRADPARARSRVGDEGRLAGGTTNLYDEQRGQTFPHLHRPYRGGKVQVQVHPFEEIVPADRDN